jgi:2-C-methyl-D-erythritol 4-phosphate cytidylyltransferase
MTFFDEEPPQPVGVVVESRRGSLPFALLHGEPLVACAAWAMGEAGIRLLDLTTPWDDVREAGAPLVWHDALCPMTPPDFLADCVRRAVDEGAVVVGVRPVTDTVKAIADDVDGPVVGATVDRDGLAAVASPIVLPATVVAACGDWPSVDFVQAVSELRALGQVVLVEAPAAARRVETTDDVRALEALTRR